MKRKISVILLAICMALTAMTTAIVADEYVAVGESYDGQSTYAMTGLVEGGSGAVTATGLPYGLYIQDIGGGGGYRVAGTVLPGTVGSYSLTISCGSASVNRTLVVSKGSQTICLVDNITSLSLHEDETYSLGAYSIDVSGNVINVSSVDSSLVAEHQPTYTYSSSDTSVATVSADGVVTGVGSGSTIITISSAETGSYLAATPITITVTSTAHTPTDSGTVVDPTCTEQGYTRYYCTTCESYYYRSYTAATGHTSGEPVVEKEVPATCTADGSYDNVVYCTDCNEELSRETITVSATGHSYEATVTAPTCTEGGYTTYTCTVCGYTYTADETAALGHTYESVVTEPTCTEGGYTTYTCSVCGESYTADETGATGHTEVTDEAVAATCTETGLTEGSHCSVCNEIIVAQEVVEATGHDYGISYFTWADNYRSATATFACANCSDEQTVNATVTVENYYGMYVYVATARYGASGATYSSVKTSGTVDMSCFETNSTEEVETEEPVEGTDTETEADEESEPIETPIETNPTTGIMLALLPMAIAMAGTVAGKKRLG